MGRGSSRDWEGILQRMNRMSRGQDCAIGLYQSWQALWSKPEVMYDLGFADTMSCGSGLASRCPDCGISKPSSTNEIHAWPSKDQSTVRQVSKLTSVELSMADDGVIGLFRFIQELPE